MMFHPTHSTGVVVIERTVHEDERGFFVRLHCPETCSAAMHPFTSVQTSLSHNDVSGGLRGPNWQVTPYAETKLVRLVRGVFFDVCLDAHPESATYRQWIGFDLDALNPNQRGEPGSPGRPEAP